MKCISSTAEANPKAFPVLQRHRKKSGLQREVGVYAIIAQREPMLSYMDVMVAMNNTDVLNAGGMQQASWQMQVAAAAEEDVPSSQADGSDEGGDGSNDDHTDGSPPLGERQGLCEHHTGHGSHSCRSELADGEEMLCDGCFEQDEYGRCVCGCDQCEESNTTITAGLEAFILAHKRDAPPEEWKMMDSDVRAALVSMSVQSAVDAEQQQGMPTEDCKEAICLLASGDLKKVEMKGEGSCLFLAVKGAVQGSGLGMSADLLREKVAVEM